MSTNNTTRRQRKAVMAQEGTKDIPFAQPDRSGPRGKSLMDLAADRQDELIQQADAINEQRRQASDGINPTESPLANALMYSVTLSMVHLTLDVLVYHQYAQEIFWHEIFARLAIIFPSLGAVIYLLYQPLIMRFARLRQSAFLVCSILAGCYLVRASNREAYIAVMRQAPPLGTFLVWFYIEMKLPFALSGLAVVGGYLYVNQYSLF